MKSAIKQFVTLAAACVSLAAVAGAQSGWNLKLNDATGPVRSPATSTLNSTTAVSEVLGGPTSGSLDGYLLFTHMPAGAKGSELFTLPVEHDYIVLTGKLNVQIGTETFVADPLTAVVVPANTPHKVWNAGSEAETDFEVIAGSHPTDLSRELKSMIKPAKATKVADAAKCLRHIQVPDSGTLKKGLNRKIYTNMIQGSPITVLFDSTLPGSGGPPTHVHRFEQVYFMVEGETTIPYGQDNPVIKKNDLVIIPPGVVHTNMNQSSTYERHVTLLLPEPTVPPFDMEFKQMGAVGTDHPDFKGGPPKQQQ